MEGKLKDIKSFETQEEYESALSHRDFVREQITLSKDRILGLTKVWDNLENDKLVIDICSFCKADQDECGEMPYCCYKEAYKEYYVNEICK